MKSSHNNLRLLLEAKNDHIEIERLLDLVFTPRRTLLSSYQLRNTANKVNNLSYVIKDYSSVKNDIYGNIIFLKKIKLQKIIKIQFFRLKKLKERNYMVIEKDWLLMRIMKNVKELHLLRMVKY